MQIGNGLANLCNFLPISRSKVRRNGLISRARSKKGEKKQKKSLAIQKRPPKRGLKAAGPDTWKRFIAGENQLSAKGMSRRLSFNVDWALKKLKTCNKKGGRHRCLYCWCSIKESLLVERRRNSSLGKKAGPAAGKGKQAFPAQWKAP